MQQLLKKIFHRIGWEKRRSLASKAYAFDDIFGHKMFQNPFDDGIDIAPLQGVPFKKLSRFGEFALIKRLRPGQVVLDLGANIGYFTLLFARQVGDSGHVYAFEPGPLSFLLLKKNIAINGYRNITPINKAVSDKSEILDLWICLTGESDNRLDGVKHGHGDRFPVMTRCIALDDELPRSLIVDYIKMDIQGAEYRALLGMRGLIERSPQVSLLMEYGPGWLEAAGVSPNDFFGLIEDMGLAMFDVPDEGPQAPVTREWLAANIGRGDRSQTNLILRRAIRSIERS